MSDWLDALRDHGLLTLPFLWTPEGEVVAAEDALTSAQRARIAAIFAAHADEQPFVVAPSPVPPMERPPSAEASGAE